MAKGIFSYASDKKKAAGRALGTLIEIITFYLLKSWDFETFSSIERPLPEYANEDITHNVEFTLHPSKLLFSKDISTIFPPVTRHKLFKDENKIPDILKDKNNQILDKDSTLRNSCTLFEKESSFINAYYDTTHNRVDFYELTSHPFAMIECKRVGVEEGNKKGPQTIEKAKQGSYVAKSVSSLQKVRLSNGSLGGLLFENDRKYVIKEYYTLLDKVIASKEKKYLKNFILTIGVVSNHGNWFTSENHNKELRVLAQSYDWLLFLSDAGISQFINELILKPKKKYMAVGSAFKSSYNQKKKKNVFTKVKMEKNANACLEKYYKSNLADIENWFNIISPEGKTLDMLKSQITMLCKKDWDSILK